MRISDWSSDVCSSDLVVSPDKEKEVCCSHRTGFLDSEPAFRLSGVVGAKNPVGLVAPSFLSSSPAKTGRVPKGRQGRRSEERRVGKECGSTCRSRGSQSH